MSRPVATTMAAAMALLGGRAGIGDAHAERAVALSDQFEAGTAEITSLVGATSRSVLVSGEGAAEYSAGMTDAALTVRVWFLRGLSVAVEQGASFRRSASSSGEEVPGLAGYGARDLRATLALSSGRGRSTFGSRLALDLPTGSDGVGQGFGGISLRPWAAVSLAPDIALAVETGVLVRDSVGSSPADVEISTRAQLNWRPGPISVVPEVGAERVIGDGIYEESFTRLRAQAVAAVEIVDDVSAGLVAGYGHALDHRFDAGVSSLQASELYVGASFTYALDLIPAVRAESAAQAPTSILITSSDMSEEDVPRAVLAQLRAHIPALRRATLSAERSSRNVNEICIELSVDERGHVVRAVSVGSSVASALRDRVEEYWLSVDHLEGLAGRDLRFVVQFRKMNTRGA